MVKHGGHVLKLRHAVRRLSWVLYTDNFKDEVEYLRIKSARLK